MSEEQGKYVASSNTVTQEQINDMLTAAFVETYTLWGKTTVVSVKLENGFVLTESSSCVDPANYNHKIGFEICMRRIENRLWELEGYKLQDAIHQSWSLLEGDEDDEA